MTVEGILSILAVLGFCVMFHEAGHFALAKISGMRVDEFAMGFGRRVLGFEYGETSYRLNLIPLGGYVRIAGMEPGEANVDRGFYRFPRWQGATVLFAGSAMNVVLAALAFATIAMFSGLPVFPDRTVMVSSVIADGAAAEAGIRAGDEIIALDGISKSMFVLEVTADGPADRAGVRRYTWLYKHGADDLSAPGDLLRAMHSAATGESADAEDPPVVTIASATYDDEGELLEAKDLELPIPEALPEEWTEAQAAGILERELGFTLAQLDHGAAASYLADRPEKAVVLTVLRDGAEIRFTVVPRPEWSRVLVEEDSGRLSSAHKQVGRIGVVIGGKKQRVGFPKAIIYGVEQSWAAVKMVASGLLMMATGAIAPEASGPVGIAAMTADRAAMGWAAVVSLGGIISANLAVINMFPFPPFDGFRIVLLAVEGVIRRRVNAKLETMLTISGVALILGLFLVITFKDIFNLMLYNTP